MTAYVVLQPFSDIAPGDVIAADVIAAAFPGSVHADRFLWAMIEWGYLQVSESAGTVADLSLPDQSAAYTVVHQVGNNEPGEVVRLRSAQQGGDTAAILCRLLALGAIREATTEEAAAAGDFRDVPSVWGSPCLGVL